MQNTSLFQDDDRPANQGQQANRSGQSAEDSIAAILESKGYRFQRQVVICRGIYETAIKTDFYLWNVPGFETGLCIESKWQDLGGTADEKLPYLVTNIRERFRYPCLVVVAGGGFRPGAIDWLKAQVDDKLVGVFGLEAFLSEVIRGFPSLKRASA